MIKRCVVCGKDEEHHAKEMCYSCYRKTHWKPKEAVCKRCHREMPMHAKGLCGGCYNFIFHLEDNKAWNKKKNFGLDYESYKKMTEKCVICGFDKVVDLHHLDENKKNNSQTNFVGLCPNHHQMLHNFQFRVEMREALKQKGYDLPIDKKLDFQIAK